MGGQILNRLFFNSYATRLYSKLYRTINVPVQIQREKQFEEQLILQTITDKSLFTPLTEDEKKQVVEYWGIEPYSYHEYEVYKHFNGFDVRFMPMSIYLPLITRRLNDYQYTEILEHKSMFGYLTNGIVHYPYCYLRVINGECYSHDMQQIALTQGVGACLSANRLVVKDSVGGSGGKGVVILKLEDKTKDERLSIINGEIDKRGKNFVIQEYLKELPELKRFNPTSVNTIRVQSLYLNGKWSPVTIMLRFGGDNAEVDNACSGGISVGVHMDGSLFEYGYNNQAMQFDRKGDIIFKDTKLSFIPQLLKHVEEAHTRQYPIVKYIGWDFMIDEDGNPVCIEINSCQNGHLTFQLSAGPTFGNRTKEVIDYCKTKNLFFNKAPFKY